MRLIFAASFACLATACMGNDMPADDEAVNCATLTADEFVVGLERLGESNTLDFTMMSGEPSPPIRGDNAWTVQIMGGTEPAVGATISVTPFMPAHQHGAGKAVKVETTAITGQYRLSPINLWMPGVWETTINVTSSSGNDKVVFSFCIPS